MYIYIYTTLYILIMQLDIKYLKYIPKIYFKAKNSLIINLGIYRNLFKILQPLIHLLTNIKQYIGINK